jgi:REP element-mobilizing transposase RayT
MRVKMAGVWHHVTNRGIDRELIFKTESDHRKFLEFLGKLPERFGFKIHGYVLMGNHYHLLIEDPELLISAGMKWLNQCYGMSFNRRHGRVGPMFQGRFKGVILDPQERGLSVSRYVHLNPVRVKSLELDKRETKAIRAGKQSEVELVRERLDCLKSYRWSSYRSYVGLEQSPAWLTTEFVLKKAGGKNEYRKQLEKEVREGMEESPWEEMKWGLVLGGEELTQRIKGSLKGERSEQRALREIESEWNWEEVVKRVEQKKGEEWSEFYNRYGDWGRNLVYLIMQERGRMTIREMGVRSGGVKERAVWAGIQSVKKKMKRDPRLKKVYECIINTR